MNDEPLILAFCCHYCACAAADMAGSMRLQYPGNVRVLRLPCTGKLEVNFLLAAFERGIAVAGEAAGEGDDPVAVAEVQDLKSGGVAVVNGGDGLDITGRCCDVLVRSHPGVLTITCDHGSRLWATPSSH